MMEIKKEVRGNLKRKNERRIKREEERRREGERGKTIRREGK